MKRINSSHLHIVECATHEIEPCVGGEDLILLVHVDDLLEREAERDHHRLRFVGHRSFQRVVLVQQEAEQFLLVYSRQAACSTTSR